MMKRMVLVSALGLLALAQTAGDALSAKPTTTTEPASALLSDRESDRIKSDGMGAYEGGVVYISGSYDFVLNVSKGSPRRFNYLYTPSPQEGCPAEGAPAGILSDIPYVNIRKINLVPIGATRANTASFNNSLGYFRFLGQDTQNPPYCSVRVMVHRLSASQWIVSTDAVTAPEVENPAVPLMTGEIAELLRSRRNSLEFLGNYPMPFAMTVTCPTCQ